MVFLRKVVHEVNLKVRVLSTLSNFIKRVRYISLLESFGNLLVTLLVTLLL